MREALGRQRLKAVYDGVAERYDAQHALFTAGSDQRGRNMVVERVVCPGDRVLDCGAGTGSTALQAARRADPTGSVTLFDISEAMLAVAKRRMAAAGYAERVDFAAGDMVNLPFEDNRFDVALSTYSLCPLYDPAKGALELYRVVRPGGRIGIAHSTEPEGRLLRWMADRVEDVVWHIPSISLGCRAVSVVPTLERAGGRVVFKRRIGVPLWPFVVVVVEKPKARDDSLCGIAHAGRRQ
jgi:ubiquinone/menaquinone biosynthesis C-methylase UbiE